MNSSKFSAHSDEKEFVISETMKFTVLNVASGLYSSKLRKSFIVIHLLNSD